ncbi:MAG: hypothetical protein AB9880_07820 [Christensenellales bacterium]
MKRPSRILAFLPFFIMGTFLFSSTANAYIDPSATTYIVQIVVGIVIAGGAALGFYLKRIKKGLRKKNAKPVNPDRRDNNGSSVVDDDEFSESKLTDDDFKINPNKKQ